MTRDEARQAILTEWAAVPTANRSTKDQAAVFVMKAMPRYDFRCGQNRFHLIMGWLDGAA